MILMPAINPGQGFMARRRYLTGAGYLDATNRVLLDRIQRSFPIVSRPYQALSEGLEIGEEEVRERLGLLKKHNLLRQVSAIFNTGALGYRSSLVATAVGEHDLDQAVAAINSYPGVSHNYLRPGPYNVWFTIAVPPDQSLPETVSRLSKTAGGWPTLILPALRKYKLAVVLDVLEEAEGESLEDRPDGLNLESSAPFQATARNIQVVRCIQEDLPLVERPFGQWAATLGMTQEELLDLIARWLNHGFMRRFAAVLNHREIGFNANGMVVWNCPSERIDDSGRMLASHPEVSHCYHRPRFDVWPFNLYAMIHGRSVEDCREIAVKLAQAIRLDDYRILFSTKEFKKIRLKLFWD
jgi:siroheme decarboxylase